MIVVDASVLVTALADDGDEGRSVRSRLIDEDLAAPELIDLEVTSVLRRFTSSDQLTAERAKQALNDLQALRIERVSHRPLLERCWSLRHNLTAYDAAYVALAEILDVTLVTSDVKMASVAGISCKVETVSAP